MNGAAFILAINLSVAGLLAAAFAMVAGYGSAYRSARWIALAYLAGMAYFAFEFLIFRYPGSRLVATAAFASFLVPLVLYAIGIARRYRVAPPWLALAAICAIAIALNLWIQGMPRDSLVRQFLWQAPYAALQALAAVLLLKAARRTWIDNALAVLLGLSALHFLAKPLIARSVGGVGATSGNYLESTYAMFSQSIGTIFAFAVALLTLAIYVRAILTDADTRSETDELSGLFNRRGFEERAERSLRAANTARVPVSLVLSDLDHFKDVNDTFGHDAGDRVIAAFAAILRDVSGGRHVVGRLGGEEFALLMPGADRQTARLVAEGSRVAFSAVEIEGVSESRRLTASYGVAEQLPGEDWRHLLRRADMALYEAKRDGRDCVRLAPSRPSGERRTLRSDPS